MRSFTIRSCCCDVHVAAAELCRPRGRSVRDEEFYDLQMPVKGCKDLYASLDEYIKEETLDGENQYQSERCAVTRP